GEQSREILTPMGDAKLGCLLDRVDGVASGIGEADNLCLGRLRLQQERREVGAGKWVADAAYDLAPIFLHHGGGVALQRMTESVIGGEKEPAIAARLHDRFSRAVGQRPRVIGPMD